MYANLFLAKPLEAHFSSNHTDITNHFNRDYYCNSAILVQSNIGRLNEKS